MGYDSPARGRGGGVRGRRGSSPGGRGRGGFRGGDCGRFPRVFRGGCGNGFRGGPNEEVSHRGRGGFSRGKGDGFRGSNHAGFQRGRGERGNSRGRVFGGGRGGFKSNEGRKRQWNKYDDEDDGEFEIVKSDAPLKKANVDNVNSDDDDEEIVIPIRKSHAGKSKPIKRSVPLKESDDGEEEDQEMEEKKETGGETQVNIANALSEEEKQREERDCRSLFLRGLPKTTTCWELENLHPDIETSRYQNKRTFGWIMFYTEEQCDKAYETLKDAKVGGNSIMIDFCGKKSGNFKYKEQLGNTLDRVNPLELFVYGFPRFTSKEDLQDIYPKAIKIRKPSLNMQKKYSKPMAFVAFANKKDAASAFEETKNLVVRGEKITVMFARLRPDGENEKKTGKKASNQQKEQDKEGDKDDEEDEEDVAEENRDIDEDEEEQDEDEEEQDEDEEEQDEDEEEQDQDEDEEDQEVDEAPLAKTNKKVLSKKVPTKPKSEINGRRTFQKRRL